MNILLSGYFDKNIGDDIMQQMVVGAFVQHKFYVYKKEREFLSHLEKYDNVYINQPCDNIDMLLNVIGTGFMYRGKAAKLTKLFSILTEKKKKYKKSAVIDCSIEEFDISIEKRLAKYELNKYDFITCRDENSYKFIKENLPNKEVKFFEDMVFASGLEKNVQKTDENLLGVAMVRRAYSAENYDYYYELAKVCDYYIEKKQKKVLLFAFDCGQENDINAALSIKRLMKYKDMAQIVHYNSCPEEFVNQMARCSFVIASRFHGMILATLLKIRSVAVYDTMKLKVLSEKYNIPSFSKKGLNHKRLIEVIENEDVMKEYDFSNARLHIESLWEYMER
ncbi:MAG: polysaccharide pyruvyl transferase family protein [Eubacteriales bacterium]|nr:polysaccharide pyruvyl transferase family protein [Eubacteriales bacterium]